jgi:queuine/archaeosine tRNA-ribosyltransferase
MPVIHGRTLPEIKFSCELTEEAGFEGGIVGLGGLVPVLQSTGSSKAARNFIVDAVRYVNSRYCGSHLHVFGAGSPNTIRALLAAGASSVDSIAWRQAAAYGSVYVAGSAQRLLKWDRAGRPPRPVVHPDERRLVEACNCPVCRNVGPDSRIGQLAQSFRARAVHNAHTLITEFNDGLAKQTKLPDAWVDALAFDREAEWASVAVRDTNAALNTFRSAISSF